MNTVYQTLTRILETIILLLCLIRFLLAMNEDNEQYWKLTGYSRGVKQTYKVPYEIDLNALEHGDLLHFYYGIKGDIVSSEKTGRSDYVLLCKAKDIIENRTPGWSNHERYPSLYTAQTQAAYDYYRGSFQLSFGYVQKVVDSMVAWKWISNDEYNNGMSMMRLQKYQAV